MTATAGQASRVVLLALALSGCGEGEVANELRIEGGDPGRGRSAIVRIGCGACHEIPGVAGADGIVGPSLRRFAQRTVIAGELANRPDVLTVWVRDAPQLSPETGMPELPLSEREARDVAAYLYTLR